MPDEPLDPAQRPAQPLPTVPAAVALKRMQMGQAEPVIEEEQAETTENRQRAANEIAMIFELRESAAFQWFEHEFIDAAYQRAFEDLRSPHVKRDDLPQLQTTYLALRTVKAGMLEREIAHREQLDPTDDQVPLLRLKLNQL